MKNGKATLADVARAARVSPTTAARVVHENGYVSEENRIAVQSAIEQLGYRPNLKARSLRMNQSRTLGLMYAEEVNPVFSRFAHALRVAAVAKGYTLLTVDHDGNRKAEATGVEHFLDQQVDYVVVWHAHNPDVYETLIKARVPIIQIERTYIPDTHLVAFDPRPGIDQAVKLLTSQGHRRIGFIGGDPLRDLRPETAIDIEIERADTFRETVARHGLSAEECPVILGNYSGRDSDGRLSGDTLMQQLLDLPGPRVTAVVVGSDMLAAGVLQTLWARRLRVPDDISVISYDDSIADMLAPQLHAIRQPYNKIAAAVMDIVEGDITNLRTLTVLTRLIERQSVGKAPE